MFRIASPACAARSTQTLSSSCRSMVSVEAAEAAAAIRRRAAVAAAVAEAALVGAAAVAAVCSASVCVRAIGQSCASMRVDRASARARLDGRALQCTRTSLRHMTHHASTLSLVASQSCLPSFPSPPPPSMSLLLTFDVCLDEWKIADPIGLRTASPAPQRFLSSQPATTIINQRTQTVQHINQHALPQYSWPVAAASSAHWTYPWQVRDSSKQQPSGSSRSNRPLQRPLPHSDCPFCHTAAAVAAAVPSLSDCMPR